MTEKAPTLTHFHDGQPRMVDVGGKATTVRSATAEGWVLLPPEARAALEGGQNAKGDPLTVARLAGMPPSIVRRARLTTLRSAA